MVAEPANNEAPQQSSAVRITTWYGLVALAAVAAIVLDAVSDIALTIKADDFILLAVFYVVAQATERLVEPLMAQTKIASQTDDLKAEVSDAKTNLAVATQLATAGTTSPSTGQTAQQQTAVSSAQQELTAAQKERAIAGWALASIFALLICGLLSLGLIGSVSTLETGSDFWKSVFSRVDVVVTGLAVGAGTKPLHDLITRIEKSKEKADPATDPAVPASG